MARRHQLPPSPSSTQPQTVKKPQLPGPQMTTSTTIRWSSLELEQQDSSQSELTPLSQTLTPSESTSPCAMRGLSWKPFTVTIPGGRHSRMMVARQANQEARMCQADPMHQSIGQGQSCPSLSPREPPIPRTCKTPSSPLSHQLHHTRHRQLDSPRLPPLTYPPQALSLLPPPAHMPPQMMVAMLIMPYGLVMRLVTTTVTVPRDRGSK
jgi:hypothetical protein